MFLFSKERLFCFVHNLGSFEGYFIFKYLNIIYKADQIYSIIDNDNKFIRIDFKDKINIKL